MSEEVQVKRRASCRLCGSTDLECMISLEPIPIAGDFREEEQLAQNQTLHPLDLYQCQACGHVQLLDVINPEQIFGDYTYFSGDSGVMVEHFRNQAETIVEQYGLHSDSYVIDVGSNDGTFLDFFQSKGVGVLGIDPAENVAEVANERGIETIPTFLTRDLVEKIKRERGPADAVTAFNVFAHNDDLSAMTECIRTLLAENGVFIFEVSYLRDVLEKMLLGTIFHEHVSYHSVKPLRNFLADHGLELIKVEHVPIQGGSIKCTAQLKGAKHRPDPSVEQFIEMERKEGLHRSEKFEDFSDRLKSLKQRISDLIQEVVQPTQEIAGFGAARGGTLFLYQYGFGEDVDFIVDENPDKQGTFSPGFNIPVFPAKEIYNRNPELVFVLAWVHTEKIINNHERFLEQDGKFVSFYPQFSVISGRNNHGRFEAL